MIASTNHSVPNIHLVTVSSQTGTGRLSTLGGTPIVFVLCILPFALPDRYANYLAIRGRCFTKFGNVMGALTFPSNVTTFRDFALRVDSCMMWGLIGWLDPMMTSLRSRNDRIDANHNFMVTANRNRRSQLLASEYLVFVKTAGG